MVVGSAVWAVRSLGVVVGFGLVGIISIFLWCELERRASAWASAAYWISMYAIILAWFSFLAFVVMFLFAQWAVRGG